MKRGVSAVVCVVTVAAAATAVRAAGNASRTDSAARVHAAAQIRDADIAFYVRRVAADPIGAADRSRLAALYLQRARETANYEDYRRAGGLGRPPPPPPPRRNQKTHPPPPRGPPAPHPPPR